MTPEQRRHAKTEIGRKQFWTIHEAAFIVGKTARTINRWIASGMKVYRHPVHGNRYVRARDVTEWVAGAEHQTRRRTR